MEGMIGEIKGFAGNFAPRAWALCEGQLLPINSNQALFSIIGTTYGGDGRTTFALPDLRGRSMIGPGNGPGLPSYREGQKGGAPTTTLNSAHLPSHNHTATLYAEASPGTVANPTSNMLAASAIYAAPTSATNKAMGGESITVANTGGGQDFNNMQPYLACYYIICLQGVFPSRS